MNWGKMGDGEHRSWAARLTKREGNICVLGQQRKFTSKALVWYLEAPGINVQYFKDIL